MVSKANLKEFVEVLGIHLMFALSVFVYLVWWLAFKEGGEIWLRIDVFGEMWFEYVLWIIITPIITLAMYYYLKEENRTRTSTDHD